MVVDIIAENTAPTEYPQSHAVRIGITRNGKPASVVVPPEGPEALEDFETASG